MVQRIPTLVVDGHVLPQSNAILEFLEETHPEKPLLPTDAFARAQVRNLCAIIGCDVQPIQNLTVQIKVRVGWVLCSMAKPNVPLLTMLVKTL